MQVSFSQNNDYASLMKQVGEQLGGADISEEAAKKIQEFFNKADEADGKVDGNISDENKFKSLINQAVYYARGFTNSADQNTKAGAPDNEGRINDSIQNLQQALNRGADLNEDIMPRYAGILEGVNKLDIAPEEKERLIQMVRDGLPECAKSEKGFVEYNNQKFERFFQDSLENFKQVYEFYQNPPKSMSDAERIELKKDMKTKYEDMKKDILARPKELQEDLLNRLNEALPGFDKNEIGV